MEVLCLGELIGIEGLLDTVCELEDRVVIGNALVPTFLSLGEVENKGGQIIVNDGCPEEQT